MILLVLYTTLFFKEIMFNFLKNKLSKIYQSVTNSLSSIFAKKEIDQATITEIEKLLISADTGITVTKKIITALQTQYQQGTLQSGSDIQQALHQELMTYALQAEPHKSRIYLLVGINGSGKTTFAGKLANYFAAQNKKCLLAAADTFRAAAPQQLKSWAQSSKADLFMGKENQDPASVAFQATEKFTKEGYDILIIDTAGRLQTKDHLMKELEKIKKTISKACPEQSIHTLLTIDAMLGQNSLQQARIFNEATQLDGLVLTKCDGTGKGGVIFGISNELKVPVEFISFGESMNDMKYFDAQEYVTNLLSM